MIDLQIGKAITPVLSDIQCNQECMNEDSSCSLDCCKGCVFQGVELESTLDQETCGLLACDPMARKDGKSVIFKQVDYSDLN